MVHIKQVQAMVVQVVQAVAVAQGLVLVQEHQDKVTLEELDKVALIMEWVVVEVQVH
jgi:hypothetical protein